MAERPLKPETIRSLGEKLDSLEDELSPDEAAVLAGLIGLAGATLDRSHSEVQPTTAVTENAALTRPASSKDIPALSSILADAFRADTSGGTKIDPLSPLADSIGVGWLCVSWSKDYNKLENPEVRPEFGRAIGRPEVALRIEGLRANPNG